ncbi:hypothetical protein [Agarilytica rhodophyticola]|uniref:hypothetical protein n=1 Tax=Agarilytica rhodophyticola TaxID=1737490 RepID=UPI0013153A78|nr:hypothetical protein [Agarilytica rhodophyticola]
MATNKIPQSPTNVVSLCAFRAKRRMAMRSEYYSILCSMTQEQLADCYQDVRAIIDRHNAKAS